MFTKKIPITEALEHHINSSSDSNGEDSSFEDPDGEFYSPPSIEDIKFKHMRYSNYRQKRVLRQKELDDDKSSSMWKSLYYTFFNNQKDNTITLSELELRCKFLFNMDDLQAKQNPNSVSNNKNKGITPLTNVEKFIKHFSEHKEDNLLIKIFRKKKNQQDIPKLSQIKSVTGTQSTILSGRSQSFHCAPQNKFKAGRTRSTHHKTIRFQRSNPKSIAHVNGNAANSNNNNDMNSSKMRSSFGNTINSKSTPPPAKLRQPLPTLLEMYDLKDSNELIEILKEKQYEYKTKGNSIKLENLNNIIENKHTFINEIEKINEIFEGNEKSKYKLRNFLDVTASKSFFDEHADVDLIHKYQNELEPQHNMSRQINNLHNKLLSKLNPLHKVNI
jgi:hypothetical protein